MKSFKNNEDYFDQLLIQRAPYQIKSRFSEWNQQSTCGEYLFWLMENDEGVQLNRGRRGSKDAGRVLLHHLGVMPLAEKDSSKLSFSWHKSKDFPSKLEEFNVDKNLWSNKMIQLGGGHDHVFHFLRLAHLNGAEHFTIINIDAHADMRRDDVLHSGTPFRRFFEQYKKNLKSFHLEQWGLNPCSQRPADLSLEGATVEVLWQDSLTKIRVEERLRVLKKILLKNASSKKSFFLVSLDVDVLEASTMSAVSAVNSKGLSLKTLRTVLKKLQHSLNEFHPQLGVYEYNPLYDDISSSGAKILAGLLYDWIFLCHSKRS
jgi:formiminoglutamase